MKFFSCALFLCFFACSTVEVKLEEKTALYLQMGIQYLKANQLSEAVTALLKAKTLQPNVIEIDNNLGLVYFFQKRYALAEKYFKNVIDQAPQFAEGYTNLCAVYLEINQADLALENCQKAAAMESNANPANAYANMAKAYLIKKGYKQALEASQKAVQMNQKHCLGLKLEGEALWNLKKYYEARQSLENAIKNCPDWVEPYFIMVKTFIGEGSFHLATDKLDEMDKLFKDESVQHKIALIKKSMMK